MHPEDTLLDRLQLIARIFFEDGDPDETISTLDATDMILLGLAMSMPHPDDLQNLLTLAKEFEHEAEQTS